MSVALLLGSVVFALGVSFLCSVMEAALLSLTPGQIAGIKQRDPKLGAAWEELKANIERPITVILTLNTAAHTIGATVAGSEFAVLVGQRWIAVFSIVFTYLMLQFTEILPKGLGVRFNVALAPHMVGPLRFLMSFLAPFIRAIHFVNRPFVVGGTTENHTAVLQELKALTSSARLSNLIGAHQERIIEGTTRLSHLTAKQVMLPWDEVTVLSTAHDLADAIVAAHMDPHTRFPVIEEQDRSRVLGYVNFKELVYRARTNPADPTLRGIIRPIHVVGPDDSCRKVMRAFLDEHVHIAIVRDAATQQTLGLLTLEDLVEELFGEIEDEFDRPPRMCQALTAGVWIVGGGLPATEMFARVGMRQDVTMDNVSAWLLRQAGGLPKLGQIFTFGERDITVRRIRRGKVFEVLVTPKGMAPRDFM